MHELPATRGLLEVALESAREAGVERVVAIEVVVGDLSTMVDDSVQFYFDLLSRGTAAEGARLRFRRVQPRGLCLACGHTFAATPPLPRACLACGSTTLRVTGGREFHVASIEVDG